MMTLVELPDPWWVHYGGLENIAERTGASWNSIPATLGLTSPPIVEARPGRDRARNLGAIPYRLDAVV